MELSITQVPSWLSGSFIICFYPLTIYLLVKPIRQSSGSLQSIDKSALLKKVTLFFTGYFIIVGLISLSGFFSENVLPPRIILFTTLPLFLFYLLYVRRTHWFKELFQSIKIEDLIRIHLFRFVGVFFILVYYFDALPRSFALIGGIGDIVTATLAIPLIMILKRKLPWAKTAAWIWNIIGLFDIASVLITAILLTQAAVANGETGVQQFATFPFSWIPAFAPATIVFIHILIFKKLREPS